MIIGATITWTSSTGTVRIVHPQRIAKNDPSQTVISTIKLPQTQKVIDEVSSHKSATNKSRKQLSVAKVRSSSHREVLKIAGNRTLDGQTRSRKTAERPANSIRKRMKINEAPIKQKEREEELRLRQC